MRRGLGVIVVAILAACGPGHELEGRYEVTLEQVWMGPPTHEGGDVEYDPDDPLRGATDDGAYTGLTAFKLRRVQNADGARLMLHRCDGNCRTTEAGFETIPDEDGGGYLEETVGAPQMDDDCLPTYTEVTATPTPTGVRFERVELHGLEWLPVPKAECERGEYTYDGPWVLHLIAELQGERQ